MSTPPYSLLDLNTDPAFAEKLGGVFEQSPWIPDAAASKRPFASLGELHRAMSEVVERSSPERQLELIRAHPDLVGKLAREGKLTAESSAEQAAAGLTQLTPEEVEKFERYNAEYREKFGFPFVICARLNKKEAILEAFPRRLANDASAERETALGEIYKIALLRLRDLIRTGRLTSHVLDTSTGKPAANLRISLLQESNVLKEVSTNADGRTPEPLLSGDEIAAGTYELRFDVGTYFGAKTTFLAEVPVRFRIEDPSEHYHVPLLVSPYSYTTYRGS